MKFLFFISIFIFNTLPARTEEAKETDRLDIISFKGMAYAPNAGGQKIYSLNYARKSYEYFGFLNQSLTTGNTPLLGVGASRRYYICDQSCFWQLYVQLGTGVSTAGIFGEVLWGVMIPLVPIWLPTKAPRYVPALRIDFANQGYFTPHRMITWSYPLWLGVSVPF